MTLHCGLCKKEVENWEEHVKNEEHKRNLANPANILEAVAESQAMTFKLFKEIEEEVDEECQ